MLFFCCCCCPEQEISSLRFRIYVFPYTLQLLHRNEHLNGENYFVKSNHSMHFNLRWSRSHYLHSCQDDTPSPSRATAFWNPLSWFSDYRPKSQVDLCRIHFRYFSVVWLFLIRLSSVRHERLKYSAESSPVARSCLSLLYFPSALKCRLRDDFIQSPSAFSARICPLLSFAFSIESNHASYRDS